MALMKFHGLDIAGGGLTVVKKTWNEYLAEKDALDESELLIEITDRDPSPAPSGNGGHVLQEQNGLTMPQRSNMQFMDAQLLDDRSNDKTKIEIVKEVEADELSNLSDGLYWTTDEDETALTAIDVNYDNTNSGLIATDVNGAIDEVKDITDDKVDKILKSYSGALDFSILTDRITKITSIYTNLNLKDGEEKTVSCRYSLSDIIVKYRFRKHIFLAVNVRHIRIGVEEISEDLGIYRQYTKLDDDAFTQTLEYRNFFPAKTFTSTVKTLTGITVGATNFSIFPNSCMYSSSITVGNTAVTLNPDFQIGNYYYYIFATFDSNAETAFANTSNDTVIASPSVLYVYDGKLNLTNHRIVKHNNKIYMAYRSTNATLTFQANVKYQTLPAHLYGSTMMSSAYFK